MAAHLRDHGHGPWGAPGDTEGRVDEPPATFAPDGSGVTVCMHLRAFQNTTSAMIAALPSEAGAPIRAWVAPGSPCVSVFVPVFPPAQLPPEVSEPSVWQAFASLRKRVESDPGALAEIRRVFSPLEEELWAEADAIAVEPGRHAAFVKSAWSRVAAALDTVSR
jgi:hypothetical protein